MRLEALDQIHVSAVKPDSLRPRDQFEVSQSLGDELMAKHPGKFRRLDDEKSLPAPDNKAEGAAPANKATGRKAKPKAD